MITLSKSKLVSPILFIPLSMIPWKILIFHNNDQCKTVNFSLPTKHLKGAKINKKLADILS